MCALLQRTVPVLVLHQYGVGRSIGRIDHVSPPFFIFRGGLVVIFSFRVREGDLRCTPYSNLGEDKATAKTGRSGAGNVKGDK